MQSRIRAASTDRLCHLHRPMETALQHECRQSKAHQRWMRLARRWLLLQDRPVCQAPQMIACPRLTFRIMVLANPAVSQLIKWTHITVPACADLPRHLLQGTILKKTLLRPQPRQQIFRQHQSHTAGTPAIPLGRLALSALSKHREIRLLDLLILAHLLQRTKRPFKQMAARTATIFLCKSLCTFRRTLKGQTAASCLARCRKSLRR